MNLKISAHEVINLQDSASVGKGDQKTMDNLFIFLKEEQLVEHTLQITLNQSDV